MLLSDNQRYLTLIILVGSFFMVELVVGSIADSITLQTDAFHMLSDLLAAIIAFTSYRFSLRSKTYKYTYGWARSEILGGLINSVFLLSTCFFLTLEIIHKMADLINNGGQNPNLEKEIDLVLIVGAIGLLINIVGLFIFRHSHHTHSHPHPILPEYPNEEEEESAISSEIINHNKSALFLHILGDFLGSVVVIVIGLCVKYIPNATWKFYLDPLASMLVIIIMTISSGKLFWYCIQILMHQSPKEIDVPKLLQEIKSHPAVHDIHEFHLWSLTNQVIIASFHVKLNVFGESDEIIRRIKDILHNYQIHSSIIQPEWDPACLEPQCQSNCQTFQCCSV